MPGATSMVVIGITALIVFGPSKLPDIGRAFGHSLREFKNAAEGIIQDDDKKTPEDTIEDKEEKS
ncbi:MULTISPECIES: twin-arginine translocase TatA/TatE family subunit [Priestia]|uniref:twin-arginine translocase TatA/TatE family subunit n=1 Tax=Priestia TaxID=2800373 RepID=UPI001AE011E4|nr:MULTISPECIES: twin-arginine translocase TatA/TatE family subunit [Priestia]MCZ8496013.1 twin-arginine translocase TatA/TatE family subunit [Priestia megaterium]